MTPGCRFLYRSIVADLRNHQVLTWGNAYRELRKSLAVNPAYLVFAIQLEKRRVLERFNQALAEMKKDGSYGKLVQAVVLDSPIRKMSVD